MQGHPFIPTTEIPFFQMHPVPGSSSNLHEVSRVEFSGPIGGDDLENQDSCVFRNFGVDGKGRPKEEEGFKKATDFENQFTDPSWFNTQTMSASQYQQQLQWSSPKYVNAGRRSQS
mmetsp:Transcript_4974/g.11871  ORF Transcript_4974/g.11871 Transcript_4974/m.11871 type:complete len:116 (-) Transcript_4974:2508-2855(-)